MINYVYLLGRILLDYIFSILKNSNFYVIFLEKEIRGLIVLEVFVVGILVVVF